MMSAIATKVQLQIDFFQHGITSFETVALTNQRSFNAIPAELPFALIALHSQVVGNLYSEWIAWLIKT
jgi:hypothetical protein